jgi:hypothetical protein
MQRLHEALRRRADRGAPVGADTMIERVAKELRGQEAPHVKVFQERGHQTTTQTEAREEVTRPTLPRRPRWRAGLAFGAALILTLGAVGVVALLPDRAGEVADTTTVTVTTAAATTDATTKSAEPTTTSATATPHVVPALGKGWEIVLSTRPGDTPPLDSSVLIPTPAGYYVNFLEKDWYLMALAGIERTLIDVGVPAHGFVTGGPGVVAWANVGPESSTDAQLWVSSDGIDFERVAKDLLAGCAGVSGCHGTEIYAAAASPGGRVVALAYDPLIGNTECDGCFDLNPVALVSDNGYEWTRQPLDLLSALPAEWQGAADIRSPLVYVDGRWLTYGTHHYDNGYTTDTAFFASDDGLDWQLIDTGDLFEGTYLMGIAANDRGVVAIDRENAYWSADGFDWSHTGVAGGDDAHKVAAYDGGYVVLSTPRVDGASMDTIWYSADGTAWTPTSLELDEPTWWNSIIGDGPNLVAVGVTRSNVMGIWRWSG